jgi:hypothetical protein
VTSRHPFVTGYGGDATSVSTCKFCDFLFTVWLHSYLTCCFTLHSNSGCTSFAGEGISAHARCGFTRLWF